MGEGRREGQEVSWWMKACFEDQWSLEDPGNALPCCRLLRLTLQSCTKLEFTSSRSG